LKFTPEGGRIDVAARLHDDRAEVSVEFRVLKGKPGDVSARLGEALDETERDWLVNAEAYQRSPHARQVPQERHFNARLEIRRPQAGQGRVCQPRGPAMSIRRSSHILRRATRARSITGP